MLIEKDAEFVLSYKYKVIGKAGCGYHLTLRKKKGGGVMSVYESIYLVFTFGILLISLISYLERDKK